MQLRELRQYAAARGWEIADLPKPKGWVPHAFSGRPARKDGTLDPKCTECGQPATHALHTGRYGEYVDTGWSGAKASRPELDRLLDDARSRKFDVVCVWKLDRWGRSVQHCLASIQELSDLGVRWIAVTQNLDTDASNPMSRLLLTIMAAIAEFEREMTRDRVTAGLRNAVANGKRLGRPPAVFDRQKVRELRAKGLSIRQIAEVTGVKRTSVAEACK